MSPQFKTRLRRLAPYLSTLPFLIPLGVGAWRAMQAQFTPRAVFEEHVNAEALQHLRDSLTLQGQLEGIQNAVQRGNDKTELLYRACQHRGECP